MTTILILTVLITVMAASPRMFVLITVILGSVVVSKFEFWLQVEDPGGNMLRNIATNVAGVILVLRGLFLGRKISIPAAMRPYLLLVGLSGAGLLLAIDTKEGMRFISVLTIPLLVYAATLMFFTEKDFVWAFKGMMVVCILQIGVGIAEYIAEPGIRVSGLHDASSVYGWFICNVIMISTYLSRYDHRNSITVGFFILIGAMMIVLTGARVALLIFPVALVFFLTEYPIRRIILIPLLIAAAAILSATLVIQAHQGTSRIEVDVESSEVGFIGEAGGTIAWRILLWQRLLEGWTERPLLGHGPGGDYAVSLRGGLTADLNYSETGPLNTHNEYIKLLFNHGIIGLLLFLIFVWRLLRLRHVQTSPHDSRLAKMICYMAISWLLLSLTDNGLSYHGQTSIIFLSLAYFQRSISHTNSQP